MHVLACEHGGAWHPVGLGMYELALCSNGWSCYSPKAVVMTATTAVPAGTDMTTPRRKAWKEHM
jgi:hypothetical protein